MAVLYSHPPLTYIPPITFLSQKEQIDVFCSFPVFICGSAKIRCCQIRHFISSKSDRTDTVIGLIEVVEITKVSFHLIDVQRKLNFVHTKSAAIFILLQLLIQIKMSQFFYKVFHNIFPLLFKTYKKIVFKPYHLLYLIFI